MEAFTSKAPHFPPSLSPFGSRAALGSTKLTFTHPRNLAQFWYTQKFRRSYFQDEIKTPVLGHATPVLGWKLKRGSMYFGDFLT